LKWELLIVRYSEIFLKSEYVRRHLTKKLSRNIKSGLKREEIDGKVKRLRDIIIVETKEIEKTINLLAHIFGIVSFSPAIKIKLQDLDSFVKKECKKLIVGKFAVRVSRKGAHEFSSNQLAAKIGEIIKRETGAVVDLKKPQTELFLDVRDQDVYIYTQKIKGPGGIPVSSQGRVNCFVSSKEDLIACWMMLKRGCRPKIFHTGYPLDVLERWNHGVKLEFFRVSGIDEIPREESLVVGFNLEMGNSKKLFEDKRKFLTPVIALSKEEMEELWERINR